jgi:hypothetical protein
MRRSCDVNGEWYRNDSADLPVPKPEPTDHRMRTEPSFQSTRHCFSLLPLLESPFSLPQTLSIELQSSLQATSENL